MRRFRFVSNIGGENKGDLGCFFDGLRLHEESARGILLAGAGQRLATWAIGWWYLASSESTAQSGHILWRTRRNVFLKLIIRRLDALHAQVDFRLPPVMRRVREISPQPFEAGQIAVWRADHGVHAVRSHGGDGLVAEIK